MLEAQQAALSQSNWSANPPQNGAQEEASGGRESSAFGQENEDVGSDSLASVRRHQPMQCAIIRAVVYSWLAVLTIFRRLGIKWLGITVCCVQHFCGGSWVPDTDVPAMAHDEMTPPVGAARAIAATGTEGYASYGGDCDLN